MLSAPRDPTQVNDKFSIAGIGFIGFFLDVGVVIDTVGDKGGEDQVALLLSTAALDEESALSDDTI